MQVHSLAEQRNGAAFPATDEVAAALISERARHHLQKAVTDCWRLAHVDAAETIYIDESEADWAREVAGEAVLEALPVCQARQWVVLPCCLQSRQLGTDLARAGRSLR
nr:hypothetical protein [Sphingomonas phyllosphaerae]